MFGVRPGLKQERRWSRRLKFVQRRQRSDRSPEVDESSSGHRSFNATALTQSKVRSRSSRQEVAQSYRWCQHGQADSEIHRPQGPLSPACCTMVSLACSCACVFYFSDYTTSTTFKQAYVCVLLALVPVSRIPRFPPPLTTVLVQYRSDLAPVEPAGHACPERMESALVATCEARCSRRGPQSGDSSPARGLPVRQHSPGTCFLDRCQRVDWRGGHGRDRLGVGDMPRRTGWCGLEEAGRTRETVLGTPAERNLQRS